MNNDIVFQALNQLQVNDPVTKRLEGEILKSALNFAATISTEDFENLSSQTRQRAESLYARASEFWKHNQLLAQDYFAAIAQRANPIDTPKDSAAQSAP